LNILGYMGRSRQWSWKKRRSRPAVDRDVIASNESLLLSRYAE